MAINYVAEIQRIRTRVARQVVELDSLAFLSTIRSTRSSLQRARNLFEDVDLVFLKALEDGTARTPDEEWRVLFNAEKAYSTALMHKEELESFLRELEQNA